MSTERERRQLRREALELAQLDEERKAEREAREADRLPSGGADQGRGTASGDDRGTRPAWAFWAQFTHLEDDLEPKEK
ncbi:MAG: hypothetical protein J0H06_09625 [Actinobacteria bacterium]|nr:hypothetical protein [Actinomycetota bacterium]OJU83501.1 MAG: hypothetical protein BGO11_13345 [Solirubrobacterales bacterium 70-9]